ncbi:MAG: NAD(P)H-dependent FMN reductase [Bermanella sp.]|jgi:NAD(P)H-dependent FMN reductase
MTFCYEYICHNRHVQTELDTLQDVNTNLLDVNTRTLEFWSGGSPVDEKAKQLIANADGYVFADPEWHSVVPPAFKNLFYYFNGLFSHKPAYIIGVSSGTGGRYPITEFLSAL